MAKTFRVFHQLHVAHNAVFRAADHRSRTEVGLTTTQLGVLQLLTQSDGQPISALAKTLAMGKSSLTGLIERMCEKGLVSRRPSQEDGRVTNIHLEDKGQIAAQQSARQINQVNQALLEPFSIDEQDTIRRFLTHLEKNADQIINGDALALEEGRPRA